MSWSHPAFESLARLVTERTGLAFPPERRVGAELGMRRALAKAGGGDPERLGSLVAQDSALFDHVVAHLTVGETYFFREPGQFAFLRETVLPEYQRDAGRPLRAWSAACSSGEEAYSLAMMLDEAGLAGRAHVLATDLSRDALARARGGVYSAWSLRDEGAAAARQYLERMGDRFRVVDAVRRLVTFEHLNLALDVYPALVNGTWGMDLIFCRNVLIYFDRETVRAVARRLFAALGEGGWLMTASSDPPLAAEAPFETVVTDQGLFYRRRAASVGPAVRTSPRTAGAPVGPRSGPDSSHPAKNVNVDRDGDVVSAALNDLARGDYQRAAERTKPLAADAAACVVRVRALANFDAEAAACACGEALARHPLSTELHYLRAVLWLGLGQLDHAAEAARRVLYLDRSVAAAHFLLGSILQQQGDASGARRAYRNARDLAAARPSEEALPLTDGETAGPLAERAGRQLARLAPCEEVRP
jgi:chemotaxis protein methyltransferase CheR